VCISSSAIPQSQQSNTKQDTCASGDKCVPAAFVEGKPVQCDSGLSGAGVCMDKCFNDLMGFIADIGLLSTKGCGTTEVCVPCSFATSGGQMVPGCQ
jgi:hypothetical protein